MGYLYIFGVVVSFRPRPHQVKIQKKEIHVRIFEALNRYRLASHYMPTPERAVPFYLASIVLGFCITSEIGTRFFHSPFKIQPMRLRQKVTHFVQELK